MGEQSLPILWLLLSAGLHCATTGRAGGNRNPRVIRLTFRNGTNDAPTNLPDRLLPRNYFNRGDRPLVYCKNAEYPDDTFCDVSKLLQKDVFPSNMKLFGASTAIPDPVREGKVCSLDFFNFDDVDVNPMRLDEIICGRDREIISNESLVLPEGIDSMALLPRFKVSDMIDVVLTSYDSGFGCKHRLKRYRGAERASKKPIGGSFFLLDSFFCSIGFGFAEGRPETPYPPQSYYKYNGKRWRPVGIWPDYV